MPIYMSPEQFTNMYCWSSSPRSGCETDPHNLSVTPGSAIHTYPSMLSDWGLYCPTPTYKDLGWGHTSSLIRLRMWMIRKLVMDLCSLEELVTPQYGSFSILSEWTKQLTWRTGCSKWVTNWAVRWQLYLEKLGKDHPGSSVAWWQVWGLFLLEWLLHTASTVWRGELQYHMQRHPHSHQATAAKDMALQTTICARPAGFYRWGNPGNVWRCLMWMVSAGAEHPPMPIPGPINVGPPRWAWQMAMEG